MSNATLPRFARRVSERMRTMSGFADALSEDAIVLVGGMSRSGTTLLATVLDAHDEIVCAAELLPGELPAPADLSGLLDRALAVTEGDFASAGRALRQAGDRPAGLFFTRCHRAGVTATELREALEELATILPRPAVTLEDRLRVACTIVRKRALRADAALYGFKYTSAAPDVATAYLPNAVFIGIVRDPVDVVLSHRKRGFDKTDAEVCAAWNAYAGKYRAFCEKHPERGAVVRYEDLVRAPRRTLKKVFDVLPVALHESVFSFHESDSPIHAGHHPNAERLRTTFSTDGVGRGRATLPAGVVHEIDEICRTEMGHYGYDNPGLVRRHRAGSLEPLRIPATERLLKRSQFALKRKFAPEAYEDLLRPYMETHEVLRLCDYVRDPDIGERRILIIRHDVDHDPETAVKIAEWEARHGLRSTYCLLHTAWYYGRLEDGRYRRSDLLIETIERLADLGHEVNFHNNLVVLALREGLDPVALLERELEFFDRLGVPVTGTSTHGDALCRELNFRNWELFRECCDDRFGGPRTLVHRENGTERRVPLGEVPMAAMGLEYEAYDIARDIYHTDSGGTMRKRIDTRGRRPFGRRDATRGEVVGVLTHPIWWSF